MAHRPEKMTLSDIICYMINQEQSSLFARIVASLPVEVSRSIPAMAVRIKDRHYVLMYNDQWIDSIHPDILIGVVEHEAHHIILAHVPRVMKLEPLIPEEEKKLFYAVSPIAVDMAANSLLKDYSKRFSALEEYGCVLPEKGVFSHLPSKMHYEFYAEHLLRDAREKMPEIEQIIKMLQDLHNQTNGKSNDYKKGFSDGFNKGMKEGKEEEQKQEGEGQESQEGKQPGKKPSQQPGSGGGGAGGGQESSQEPSQQPGGSGGGQGTDDYNQGYQDGYNLAKNAPDSTKSIDPLTWELLKQHMDIFQDFKDIPNDEKMSVASDLDQQNRSLLQKAINDHRRAYGTLPGYMDDIISALEKGQIPWTKILRTMVINSQKTKRVRSIRRPHRRHHGIPKVMKFPGKIKDRIFKIVFIIDTSGSMGQEELAMAIGELQSLQKVHKEMKITVLEADVDVEKEYDLGQHDKVQRNVMGRGGTSFDPALARAKEIKPDICFYFTDGYAPAPMEKNRLSCPFCWVITPNGTVPDENYGHVLKTKEVV